MPSRPPETKEIQLLEGILAALKQPHPPEQCSCREELAKLNHELERGNEGTWLLLEALRFSIQEQIEANRQLSEISNKIDQLIPELGDATDKIVIVFGGNMPRTPGTVAAGSTVVASIVPLEADGVTVTPGAVVSNAGYAIDDSTIASFVVNPDGTATFTGLAAGTANVTATATVTDASGIANTFTSSSTALTVTAVTPPTETTASIQVNFAPPLTASLKK